MSALLAVSEGPQSQFRYCWWYRSRYATDFDNSETAAPVIRAQLGSMLGSLIVAAKYEIDNHNYILKYRNLTCPVFGCLGPIGREERQDATFDTP